MAQLYEDMQRLFRRRPASPHVQRLIDAMNLPPRTSLIITRPHASYIVIEVVTTTCMRSRSSNSTSRSKEADNALAHLASDIEAIPGICDTHFKDYGVVIEVASTYSLGTIATPIMFAFATFCRWLGERVAVTIAGEPTDADMALLKWLFSTDTDGTMYYDFTKYVPMDYPDDPEPTGDEVPDENSLGLTHHPWSQATKL